MTEQEIAGIFLFVNLYSARTGGYKLTTRQEQETFLPAVWSRCSLSIFLLSPQFIAL